MKRIFTLLSCAAALFLVSCMNDIDEGLRAPSEDAIPVELFNSINQVAATRVNDEGFCDGDGVGIYVVNHNGESAGEMLDKGNQADNVRYVYNESENKWVPDYPVYYYDKVTPVDIIGYYPYVSKIDKVNTYSFELQKDQSADMANGLMGGYEASDFLWGKAEKISPTSSRVNITFHHIMSGVQVELVEGAGFDDNEWSGLDKQVLVTNTIRKATIDLSNGMVTPIGEVPTTGTIPAPNGEQWRSVVVPQTVDAQKALFNITVDGTPYVFRKSEEFEYISGKLHKFTIEVSKKSASGLEFKLIGEAITAWESETITHDGAAREYVVVNVPKASSEENVSALKAAIEASGKDYTKIKNLKIIGEVNANDFYFMRDEMTALQSVNMKEVCIVAFRGWYPANEIPSSAFRGKSTLVRFVFPEGITKILDSAFYETNLSGALMLPNNITYIGYEAFAQCSSLTSLNLPNKIEEIDALAFEGCSGFSNTLYLPSTLVSIGRRAFNGCGFRGNLILPENLNYIGAGAFCGCGGLTGDLTIPKGVTALPFDNQLWGGTFAGCGFNGTLTLHDSITVIDKLTFSGCHFKGALVLPQELIKIGEMAFNNTTFSGTLIIPDNVQIIESSAFNGCGRLSGIVELPEDLLIVSDGAFAHSSIEGVVINSNIEQIQGGAFANCLQLNSIVCKAKVPPTLDATAFVGVAKDNFVLEVPEASVADYALAPNWNEFKRIAAHREFSISRNLFRTLNAENSKTLILRAESGAAWSVESCPNWVTVSPSNGVGKTEITISVNEMSAGDVATFNVETYESWGSTTSTTYNGRAGEIVFLLDGKDYRTRTKVEQYDYQYGDGDVITNQTASAGNGVNIVFMGDCFDAQDIATGKYLDGINEAIEYFFAIEPYATYKEYFNVYTVFGLSTDSGIGTINTIREAKFGSQYGMQSVGSVGVNENICFEYACKSPTVTKENIHQTPIVLIENSYEYDGVTYMWDDGSAIALVPMSQDEYPYDFRGVLQHEVGGHAFGKLGDEYIYCNAFITACGKCGDASKPVRHAHSLGWYKNLSLTGNIYDVAWSHLIFDEKYQNTVDIYEGGYMHTRGCFRSEQNSCMNNNIPYFSAISRQAIVERIMEYAGEEFSFEEWKANDKGIYTSDSYRVSTRSATTPNYVERSSGLQQPPKFMGEKPNLNFNK